MLVHKNGVMGQACSSRVMQHPSVLLLLLLLLQGLGSQGAANRLHQPGKLASQTGLAAAAVLLRPLLAPHPVSRCQGRSRMVTPPCQVST
jgi:hypothetical protein